MASSSKVRAEPRSTRMAKPGAWSSLVLKRVLKLPSRALAGGLVLEGASVLATQPVRARAVPLAAAAQLEPGTAVVVVVGSAVVVVAAAAVVVVAASAG